jgi:radical SAM superfamily enzyme YgiQ (UPF0313 family)
VAMERYGWNSRNHPGLVSIEHSRGCIDTCRFCILWKQMGESVNGNGQVRARYRSKSGGRSFEEVQRLYRQFGRRTFGWVDPTFNAQPEWAEEWSERMLRSELMDERGRAKTVHTAWLRADGVVRDEKLGILEKLVRAGLRQVMIGVEREDEAGLAALGKHNNSAEVCREAFAIFRRRYPEVYTIGTVIFGLPQDTEEDLRRLIGCEDTMGMDYCFVIPLTPNPGTEITADLGQKGYIVRQDRVAFNFHTPVCRTESLGPRELENLYWRLMLNPSGRHLWRAARRFAAERDGRKRRVHWSMLRHGTRIALKSMGRALTGKQTGANYSRRPSWYNQ